MSRGADLASIVEGHDLAASNSTARKHPSISALRHHRGRHFFTVLGTLLDYHVGNSCYVRNHVHTAIVVVIVGNYFIIACNFLGVALIFSVFAHLPSEERWNRMFSILGCCLCMPRSSERERNNQGTLSQIATCFSEVFQGADLVPSDIAAGLALLALQHRGVLEGKPLGWNVLEGSSFSVNETFPTNTEGRDVLNAGNNASKSLNPKGYGASTSTDGSVHQRTEAKGLSAPNVARGVIRHAG